MKTKLRAFCLFLPFLSVTLSCDMLVRPEDEGKSMGELRISFAGSEALPSKSLPELPDTSDFILTVADAEGNVIYDGAYGASPESLIVDPGSYTVNVRSCDFTKPAFSKPQFGDEQCVVVPSGGVSNVRLTCRQMNSGMILRISPNFLEEYPSGVLFLKSAQGKLMYGYSEKRAAYFLPGAVSLMMSDSGNDRILMTRTLQAQDMLVVNVSAASSSPEASGQTIKVAVDTTRIWNVEDFVIGGTGNEDGGPGSAYTVSQARDAAGETDVWVCGYIVGGDLSSSSASFERPFQSRTNILLGPKSSTKDKSSCLSVQLVSGAVRDALNLVDNPSLLGRKVYIKADIVESYYGIPGLKNISDHEL